MGKRDKAKAADDGRVPLVQDGKPLLYPRYTNIDELLQIGTASKAENGDGADAKPTADGSERPSKKQKRAAAATATATAVAAPCDGDQAATAAAGKGYGVVGEDGLTYKQRRQQRRAAEREAKAQADAAAAAAAGELASGIEAAPAEADGVPGAAPADAKKKDKKKKGKRKRDGREGVDDGAAAADGGGSDGAAATAAAEAAVPKAQGNADEAAKLRAVLGFTSGGVAPGAALSLQRSAPAAALAAAVVSDTTAGASEPSPTGVKQKKQKKQKKVDRKGGAGAEGAAAEDDGEPAKYRAVEGEPRSGGGGGDGAVKAAAEGGASGRGKPGSKGLFGGGSGKQFSFDFKVQAEVEAETEAKLARLMALDSAKDGFVPRRVWVSGLPHEFDQDTVREYWDYCGEVESMHLLTFPDSGNFNGTAYITFKTQEGYEAALACHGEMLEGRSLRVEKCKVAAEIKGKARASVGGAAANGNGGGGDGTSRGGGSGGGSSGGVCAPGYSVAYVGNIAFEAEPEELQALFKAAGAAPTKVRLHSDKASGRSKGFAHVHFASEDDVDRAVELDGTTFHGRKIRVSYAQPKPGEVA